ncbi:MAG TPA: response regulator transcription factor [Candidatus Eisenbacteria bacterium]|nr:response regulator transcription factor [Candidatus Eisenbacteria bacterium]
MATRVLLVDDHAIVREGLRALLTGAGLLIVGEAADGRAAARLARKLQPDVVVMDIGMPLLNGVDGAVAVRRQSPGTRVVALTVHSDDHYVKAALRAGIRGYVIKSQAAVDLVTAIDQVSHGSVYLSPGVSPAALDSVLDDREAAAPRLTPREREVLQLVAEGKRSKEIADVLGISQNTAETHRAHIMEKLAIHDTAGLVRYAIRAGMLTP